MANVIKTCFLTLLFVLASCSFFHTVQDRPANRTVANVVSPMSVEELLTFKSGTVQSQTNALDYLKISLNRIPRVKLNFVYDPQMPTDEAYKILPELDNQTYTFKIFYSASAIYDNDASQEVAIFFNKIMAGLSDPYALMELYYNGKEDDFVSLEVLAKLRKAAALDITNYGGYRERMAERQPFWQEIESQFEKMAKVHNKEVKIKEQHRKKVMDALDKATGDEQFRTMVAKNDRKGAADLIRAYLPWERMPPFEKKFWENHLKVMIDPLPIEQRVMIYRGIDEDPIQVAIDGAGELTKEEALRKQKIFLMSTLMTKNQGTWNRRLRSLTSMYDKFIATNKSESSEFTRAARMTTMFSKHSADPKGSPFLSLSPKYGIARDFGQSRITMLFMDPRLLYFNYASEFTHEIEFLVPLVTFPDELGAVYDIAIHEGVSSESFLHKTAIERLNGEFAGKGEEIFEAIKSNSAKHFMPVSAQKNGALPSSSDFFKKNLGAASSKVAKQMGPGSDIPCMDLIQLFWK